MNKKVSVVIPTYGRADLLPRAIDSVLGQTYNNIEVIVVDDNKSDGQYRIETKGKLRKYKKNNKVIYIERPENGGGSAARNTGIEHSTGHFITFLDDDDYYLPEKIEKQIKYIEDMECDICLCDMYIEFDQLKKNKSYLKAQCDDLEDFIIRGLAYTPMILVTKEAVSAVNGFTETPRFQDHLFIIKLLKLGYKPCILHEKLAVHCRHSGERITRRKGNYNGYYIRHKIERKCFNMLSVNAITFIKLKHICVESKIKTDIDGWLSGFLWGIKGIIYIRNIKGLGIFVKNILRNIFLKESHF